jgi:hypothetical protein
MKIKIHWIKTINGKKSNMHFATIHTVEKLEEHR